MRPRRLALLLPLLGGCMGTIGHAGPDAPDAAAVSGGPDAAADTDATPGPDAGPPPPFVDPLETTDGPIHGRVDTMLGLHIYQGIPYAAPPVDALRFADPQPNLPWTAPRDATAFGKFCPQLDSAWGPAPAAAKQSEDCLTLNVWTPAASPADALPVLVFLHGGSFVVGGSGYPAYDGARLAAEGHVVVVSLNYRLGTLGFLAHATLSAASPHASSGNFGILDQIHALHWLKDNLRAFGGDPDRVTLFGHSSGGASVCTLYASPLAQGLYARAIIQSGFCSSTTETLADEETLGAQVATTLGCSGAADVPACLRAASVDAILHALGTGVQLEGGVHYRPIVDGYLLDKPSAKILAAGDGANVPLVIGTSADEGSLYAQTLALGTVAAYQAWIQARWPNETTTLLDLYPAATDADVNDALAQLVTHWLYTCPARRIAGDVSAYASVWRYQFEHVSWDAAQRGVGAYHGAELPYLFHYFKTDAGHMWTADDASLSAQIIAEWSAFAHDASFNWPEYGTNDPYEVLDWPLSEGEDLDGAACDVWDSLHH